MCSEHMSHHHPLGDGAEAAGDAAEEEAEEGAEDLPSLSLSSSTVMTVRALRRWRARLMREVDGAGWDDGLDGGGTAEAGRGDWTGSSSESSRRSITERCAEDAEDEGKEGSERRRLRVFAVDDV